MEASYSPPPLGPYQYHEVISSLRKEIKLKNEEAAIYWCNVLITYLDKGGPATVAKQLWIMAAEDLHDPSLIPWAFAVYTMASKVPETDHVYFLVSGMCRAKGWWETEDGRRWNRLWSKAIGDLKKDPRPIPDYALDRHTRRGFAWLSSFKAKFKKEHGRDPSEVEEWGNHDEFSGTDVGQQKTLWKWLRYGRLSPDDPIDYAKFEEFYEERRRLEGRGLKTPAVDGQESLI